MITKKVTLNEILHRYDDEGVLRGTHMRFLTRIVDEDTGEVLLSHVDDPVTLEQAEASGVVSVATTLQKAASDAVKV